MYYWIVWIYQAKIFKKRVSVEIYCLVKHGSNFTVQHLIFPVLTGWEEHGLDLDHQLNHNQRNSSPLQRSVILYIHSCRMYDWIPIVKVVFSLFYFKCTLGVFVTLQAFQWYQLQVAQRANSFKFNGSC